MRCHLCLRRKVAFVWHVRTEDGLKCVGVCKRCSSKLDEDEIITLEEFNRLRGRKAGTTLVLPKRLAEKLRKLGIVKILGPYEPGSEDAHE